MLTYVHKVIHKVVGTFAKVFERKRKVKTPSLSWAPARPINSSRGTREGAERADAGYGTLARSVHMM
jgi:hypothetical protein